MKKLLILLPFLFASLAAKPDAYAAGFVLTLTNGQSYTTNARSHTIEYCQTGRGVVALPVYWTSDAEKVKRDLNAMGALVRRFEQHSNPWIYNYIFLDPINISSIDILDAGAVAVFKPIRYDHKKLMSFAYGLSSSPGLPIEVPDRPGTGGGSGEFEEVRTVELFLIGETASVSLNVVKAEVRDEFLMMTFPDKQLREDSRILLEAYGFHANQTQRGIVQSMLATFKGEYPLAIELKDVITATLDGECIYKNEPTPAPPIYVPPVDTVPDEPRDPVVDEPKDPADDGGGTFLPDEPAAPDTTVVDEPIVVDEPTTDNGGDNPDADAGIDDGTGKDSSGTVEAFVVQPDTLKHQLWIAYNGKGGHGKGHHPMAFNVKRPRDPNDKIYVI